MQIWYLIIIALDIPTTCWSCMSNVEVLSGLKSQTRRCSDPTQHSGRRGVWHHISQRYQGFLTFYHHRDFNAYTDLVFYTCSQRYANIHSCRVHWATSGSCACEGSWEAWGMERYATSSWFMSNTVTIPSFSEMHYSLNSFQHICTECCGLTRFCQYVWRPI